MQRADCIHPTKVNTTLKTQYAMQHKCNATQIQCNTNGPIGIHCAEFFIWCIKKLPNSLGPIITKSEVLFLFKQKDPIYKYI